MLDVTSPHFGFVLASYGLSAAVLIGLVIWTFLKKRRLEAEAQRHSSAED
jgi:heme exporter protein CcmD